MEIGSCEWHVHAKRDVHEDRIASNQILDYVCGTYESRANSGLLHQRCKIQRNKREQSNSL